MEEQLTPGRSQRARRPSTKLLEQQEAAAQPPQTQITTPRQPAKKNRQRGGVTSKAAAAAPDEDQGARSRGARSLRADSRVPATAWSTLESIFAPPWSPTDPVACSGRPAGAMGDSSHGQQAPSAASTAPRAPRSARRSERRRAWVRGGRRRRRSRVRDPRRVGRRYRAHDRCVRARLRAMVCEPPREAVSVCALWSRVRSRRPCVGWPPAGLGRPLWPVGVSYGAPLILT